MILCLALFTAYFRESDDGALHGAQSTAASVIAPVQEVATRAVEPFRDAWGWASSLKDARDRAASLETEVDRLRGEVVFSDVQAQRLAELEKLLGVETLVDASKDLGGYEARTELVVTRSISPWWRSARVGIGSSDGVMRNSPVLAGSQQGAALVGIVTNVSSGSADVAFITDGRTEVGARIPDAGPYFGLLSVHHAGPAPALGHPEGGRGQDRPGRRDRRLRGEGPGVALPARHPGRGRHQRRQPGGQRPPHGAGHARTSTRARCRT